MGRADWGSHYELAIRALQATGRPMKASEIVAWAQEKGIFLNGVRPDTAINSTLNRISKNDINPKILKSKTKHFYLSIQKDIIDNFEIEYIINNLEKTKRALANSNRAKGNTLPNIAKMALEEKGHPMSPLEIVHWARKNNIPVTGKTPQDALRYSLTRIVQRAEDSPFVKLGERFALAKKQTKC